MIFSYFTGKTGYFHETKKKPEYASVLFAATYF